MMMMMDYGSQYASSTMSSETLSGSCGSRTNRIRTVRLVRPNHAGTLPPPSLTCRHGPNLGFSIRGGREHGTGFFVSHIEVASEAHRQGLRVGDQIIRVNGFTVDDAVHKEVLQLISNHTHLTLKVRSVGMIPVKDRKTDSLSWQIITDNSSSLRSSPQLGEKIHDVRISIMVAPRSKLGCGICKGPEWKPGIFVQFTKEGGIAREAGLRPGDQILYCNNVDFSDIPFNEAVNLMKTSRQLDLIIRKSAGSELFPGESSGYNSSASSVTGDQSPSWSDSKRLSIVKEESLDLEDRLSQLDRLKCSKKWDKIDWDDVDAMDEKPYFKPTIINLSENGTTIKNNGSEDCQTVLENSLSKSKGSSSCLLMSPQHETKTVVVEVHRSDSDDKNNNNSNNKTDNLLMKSSSTSSFGSLMSSASSSLSSAICQEIQRRSEKIKTDANRSSIDEQLQKKKILKGVATVQQQQHSKLMDEFKKAHRKMFKASDEITNENSMSSADKQCHEKEISDRIAGKELSQKLSERLSTLSFQESEDDRSSTLSRRSSKGSVVETPPTPPPLPLLESQNGSHHGSQNGSQNMSQCSTHNGIQNSSQNGHQNSIQNGHQNGSPNGIQNGQQNFSSNGIQNGQQNFSSNGIQNANHNGIYSGMVNGMVNGIQNEIQNRVQNGSSPNTRSNTLKPNKTKPKAPPVPVKTSTLSSYSQPPPCPTPDYDTLSLSSNTSTLPKQNGYTNGSKPSQDVSDAVEMESLESFKLNNPYGMQPKPPSTYFQKRPLSGQLSNGSVTSTISRPLSGQLSNSSIASNTSTVRKARPVSVTIGEYPSATLRRQPGRLDFLNGHSQDDGGKGGKQPITSQFASELQQTLSRSNLKKRTESMVCKGDGNYPRVMETNKSSNYTNLNTHNAFL